MSERQENPIIRPLLVGLTGGIGSGKSTVLQLFRQQGVPCFEADSRAACYYNEPAFLDDIRHHVSPNVFFDNGTIDKQALAHLVFCNPEKLSALCSLIHPRVLHDFIQWAGLQDTPYVMIESAILFEYQWERHVHYTIAVYLEQEERITRLQQRDHATRETIEARMRNQMSDTEKMNRADYVILNYEGNPRERQVGEIHRRLLQKADLYHQRKEL